MEIDINCDLGEGICNEKEVLPLISSCSIACGGHAGDDQSMKEVALLAHQFNVKVGAHPSYPDRTNFGRLSMQISPDELIVAVQGQVSNFADILYQAHVPFHHIKAHGALYNDLLVSADLARAYLTALTPYKNDVFLYVPFNSVIEGEALVAGFQIKYEAFADRNYRQDGTLLPRKEPNALINRPQEVVEHLARMVCEREVKLLDGKRIRMLADTYCVHGDIPNALEILAYIAETMSLYGIGLKK